MISELLPEEKRKLHELEQQFTELERGSTTVQATDICIGLDEINHRLTELDKLALKESKARRDDYRRRVLHLRATYNHIKSSLESLIRRKDRSNFDKNKNDLFGKANLSGSNEDLELEMAENGSLTRSNKMLNEYLTVGEDTLSNLVSQKERLKSIQRKAFDILNYLGIANSLIKVVERRDVVDKWITYLGMIIILAFICFVWFFLVK